MIMDRRSFIATGLAAGAAISTVVASSVVKAQDKPAASTATGGKFKMKYAPSFGSFPNLGGKDQIGQLQFMADQGFSAVFDNGMMGRSPEEQEKIAKELERLGMTLGPFVAHADFGKRDYVHSDQETRDAIKATMQSAVETAKRAKCKWALVVPGAYDTSLEWDYQTANVIENLKVAAGVCEPSGLVIVIEPLNPHDHPGLFLTKIPQAYQICRAVGSPSCKIINDIYHQQITEGNLIPNIDRAWSEIAAFHLGDNPGRMEPGTGEINFKNIFKHLSKKGYQGVLCMEHGVSKRGAEGEKALIEAYKACDSF
jgi:hydroxypyruvate isomerase